MKTASLSLQILLVCVTLYQHLVSGFTINVPNNAQRSVGIANTELSMGFFDDIGVRYDIVYFCAQPNQSSLYIASHTENVQKVRIHMQSTQHIFSNKT